MRQYPPYQQPNKDKYQPKYDDDYSLFIFLTGFLLIMFPSYLYLKESHIFPVSVIKLFIVIDALMFVYFIYSQISRPKFKAPSEYGNQGMSSGRNYEFMSKRGSIGEFQRSDNLGNDRIPRYPMTDGISQQSYSYANKIVGDNQEGYEFEKGISSNGQRSQQNKFNDYSYQNPSNSFDGGSFLEKEIIARNRRGNNQEMNSSSFGIKKYPIDERKSGQDSYRYFDQKANPQKQSRFPGKESKSTHYGGFSSKRTLGVSPYREMTHFYDKGLQSMKKGTISKKSVISGYSRNQSTIDPDYYSKTEYIKNSLDSIKIDHKKFNSWATRHFKTWIFTTLSQEILEKNKQNFTKINDVLLNFGMSLLEYNNFCRMKNFNMNQTKRKGPSLKTITVNNLMNLCYGVSFENEEWMRGLGSLQVVSLPKISQLSKEMKAALIERQHLDKYFRIGRIQTLETGLREYIICCLQDYFKSGQSRSHSMNDIQNSQSKECPSHQEIQMAIFFNYFFDHHPQYNIDVDWIRLFKNPQQASLNSDEDETHFYVRKTDHENYKCVSKDTELFCYLGPNNVYCVMTYFLNHVKTYHHRSAEKLKGGLLEGLLDYFSIRAVDNYQESR